MMSEQDINDQFRMIWESLMWLWDNVSELEDEIKKLKGESSDEPAITGQVQTDVGGRAAD
jgi:hypothetical protein